MTIRKHSIKYTETDLFSFDSSLNFESNPDSIMTSTRDTVFFVWQTLEETLSTVDSSKYPDISKALDVSAASVFEAWLTFRDIGRGEV